MNDVSFRISAIATSPHKISQLFANGNAEIPVRSEENEVPFECRNPPSSIREEKSQERQKTLEEVLRSTASTSSSPVKIFNPEAFCEICQKEFCNKYYLATHRATKHGIVQRSEVSCGSSMLQQSQMADFGLRADLGGVAQNGTGIDINQLLLAGLDPNALAAGNPLRHLYLSQLAQLSGGSPSPASSAPSSTAPSESQASTIPQSEASSQAVQCGATDLSQLPNWFAGMMPNGAQNSSLPNGMSSILEQMQAMSGGLNLLGANSMNAFAVAMGSQGQQTPLTPNSANNIVGGNASQKDAYCNLCDKTFCNRTFLRTHMQNKHGITDNNEMSPQKAASPSMGAFPFTIPPSTSAEVIQNSVIVNTPDVRDSRDTISDSPKREKFELDQDADEEKDFNKSSLDNLLMASMGGTSCPCDECGKEFPNIFAVMAHKTRDHVQQDSVKEEMKESMGCNECDEKFDSIEMAQQHQLLAHGGGGMARQLLSNLLPPGFPGLPFMMPGSLPPQFHGMEGLEGLGGNLSTPKPAGGVKRQYSSNGKNYCDLCNKEVCNKYFLRTHMLKMHGIVIDENKTIIANIDTLEKERMGALSFRCDICMAELKSRHLLRQHKQDKHGVVPLSTPHRTPKPNTGTPSMLSMNGTPLLSSQSDTSAEKCPVCDRRIAPGSIAQHLQMEHSNEVPAYLLHGLQQQQDSFTCKFCPLKFQDELECQMHAISQHAPEILAVQAADNMKKFVEDENMEKCNQCDYRTKSARNLELHMERHERMNEAKSMEDEDDALKITQEVALQMAQQNTHLSPPMQFSLPIDTTNPSEKVKCGDCNRMYSNSISMEKHYARTHTHSRKLSLRPKKKNVGKIGVVAGIRKLPFPCAKCPKRFKNREQCLSHLLTHLENARENVHSTHPAHERNSHTSGSMSPSGESLPEGFGRVGDPQGKQFLMQTFVIKDNQQGGHFLNEIVCHLPVRSMVSVPTSVTFDLIPASSIDSSGFPHV